MIGWYVGRTMLKAARRDLMSYREVADAGEQAVFGRRLATAMARVEHNGHQHGVAAALRAATGLLRDATHERQMAVAAGARSSRDQRWLEAAVIETWAAARVAQFRGKISLRAFKRIDEVYVAHLIAMIGFEEVKAIATDMSIV